MLPATHRRTLSARHPVRTAWLVANLDSPMPELRPVRFAAEHDGLLTIDELGGLRPIARDELLPRTSRDDDSGGIRLPRELDEDLVALLLTHGTQCYVVDMARRNNRTAGRNSAERRAILHKNGAPLVGGIATVRHGDWLTVPGAPTRVWLSHEGPWPIVAARAGDPVCALTLDAISPGQPIVRCGCSAVFHADTWRATHRCCRCGAIEDGQYRLLPPGSSGRRS